jgi:glycosyltransferase involved in cell wall biosynthesis
LTSVVIAAHNEAAVIGRCLDALLADPPPGPFDVTVVANGCTDATVAVAATRPGVRVLSLPEPGKAAALNAGDEVAVGFPRLYLDADIVLTPGSVPALVAAVEAGLLAAAPGRALDTAGRPLPVRAYYAINRRLPAFRDALYGRGAIVLSERGRARFGAFPALHADDLFLDSLFEVGEKREVAGATAKVATPRRTADLIRRLVRVRAGNAAMRAAGTAARPSRRSSWLWDVVLRRPWLAPAGVFYAAITLIAERRSRGATDWGRDESSRTVNA